MECQLIYLLQTPGGQEAGSGKAKALIDFEKETLTVKPSSGDALDIPVNEIDNISGVDYKINLTLSSRETLILSELGYAYEDFLRVLTKLRADVAQKDMLMKESEKKGPVEAFFVYSAANGDIITKGDCRLALFETGLVVISESGTPMRFPYSDISQFSEDDFALLMQTEDGEKLRFSKMGRQFDPTKEAVSKILNELSVNTQNLLREMLPSADQMVVRKIAALMRDGKAARKGDIETISAKAWKDLENKLAEAGMKNEYDFLKSLSNQEKVCIGIKRGLMGSLTGDYIWFLTPVYGGPKKPGNAIAMEAYNLKPPEKKESGTAITAKNASEAGGPGIGLAGMQQLAAATISKAALPDSYYPDLTPLTQDAADSEESPDKGGKATYFFRIASKDEYKNFKNQAELDKQVDTLIKTINRCMLSINFRREPIYLDEEKLEESQYKKYRLAVRSIPALQTLRQSFIGRVIHSSPKQWENDVKDLLKSNVT